MCRALMSGTMPRDPLDKKVQVNEPTASFLGTPWCAKIRCRDRPGQRPKSLRRSHRLGRVANLEQSSRLLPGHNSRATNLATRHPDNDTPTTRNQDNDKFRRNLQRV